MLTKDIETINKELLELTTDLDMTEEGVKAIKEDLNGFKVSEGIVAFMTNGQFLSEFGREGITIDNNEVQFIVLPEHVEFIDE